MKKLLIMGANPETVSLIKKAKEMGIKTYVTDYNPKAYAKKFADVAVDIDGCAIDEIVNFVREEKIDAVLVGVAEALVPAYYAVCEKLNIPCFATMEQFEIMINKDKFKKICRENGVPVVEEYFDDNLQEDKYPVIVKPVDSSSSKGISICNNKEELDVAIKTALSFSRRKKYIVEKYMNGLEAIVYYVMQNGEPSLVAMCDRYTSKEQEGITQLPSAYIFPSKHIEKYVRNTNEKVCKMLKKIDIKNGVLFLQAFVENGDLRIYEPGFRLNGAQEHIIVSKLTGIDAKELLINFAFTGEMSDKQIKDYADPYFKGKCACKLSPLVKEGTIAKIDGVESVKKTEGVISVNLNYEEGGKVAGLGTQRQMAANIFIVAENFVDLKERVDKVNNAFKVYDGNGDSMLLKPFDTNIIKDVY